MDGRFVALSVHEFASPQEAQALKSRCARERSEERRVVVKMVRRIIGVDAQAAQSAVGPECCT